TSLGAKHVCDSSYTIFISLCTAKTTPYCTWDCFQFQLQHPKYIPAADSRNTEKGRCIDTDISCSLQQNNLRVKPSRKQKIDEKIDEKIDTNKNFAVVFFCSFLLSSLQISAHSISAVHSNRWSHSTAPLYPPLLRYFAFDLECEKSSALSSLCVHT
ncbi:unnamed protein product, partial [Ectocarpus sp. 6 AP-2014]